MSRTRLLGAITAVIVPILLLSSCGGESGPKPIVIWMQMDPQERERFVANLEAYQEIHPDVLIEHLPFDTEQLKHQPFGVDKCILVTPEEVDRAIMLDLLTAGAHAPDTGAFQRVLMEMFG